MSETEKLSANEELSTDSASQPEISPNELVAKFEGQTADRPDAYSDPIVRKVVDLFTRKQLIHDKRGSCFVAVDIDGHLETHEIGSNSFRRYVGQVFWKKFKRTVSSHNLEQLESTLRGRAQYEGIEEEVFLRVGQTQDAIYIDLGDETWSVIEVDAKGWRLLRRSPVKFRRSPQMSPLPTPVTGGDVSFLRPFLNCSDDDFKIVVGFVIATFRPDGPYPILEITGEQGSAKSTATRIIRDLVDPHGGKLRAPVSSERDLAILAHNAWLVVGDNLSGMRHDMSDAFCRLSTGGAFSTRKLYTNDEEQIFDYCRPAILNGIDDIATRPDLLSRCWCVELPRLTPDTRKAESDLWASFAVAKPKIFGGILDALSCSINCHSVVKLPKVDRLADAVRWVTAAEPALKWDEHAFAEATSNGRTKGAHRALDQFEGLVGALRDLANKRWTGTAADLCKELSSSHSAASIGTLLRRLAPALNDIGIDVKFFRQGKESRRFIDIRTVGAVGAVG